MKSKIKKRRVICWFSCGATSAVACKIALKKYKDSEVLIYYCDTGSEHFDNVRFLRDCENWFNHKIIVLKSKIYQDIWDVFVKTKYIAGINGARCTLELKKKLRYSVQKMSDIQVFGFDSAELKRVVRFKEENPDVTIDAPLLEHNISKSQCLMLIRDQGIELPEMYKLGYTNNNCIGCVKGGMGYWNKIRKDFPECFNKMLEIEKSLGVRMFTTTKNGIRIRLSLDDLTGKEGNYNREPGIECGVLCDIK